MADMSVLRSTATVCSCAATSSIVFGRLRRSVRGALSATAPGMRVPARDEHALLLHPGAQAGLLLRVLCGRLVGARLGALRKEHGRRVG